VTHEHEREDVPAGRGQPDAKGPHEQGRHQADPVGKVGLLALAQDQASASAGLENSPFGTLWLTDSQLSRLRDWEVVALLVEAGSSRLTAERIVAIERGGAEPGRPRRHAMSRH
jgi:hypothetical protein